MYIIIHLKNKSIVFIIGISNTINLAPVKGNCSDLIKYVTMSQGIKIRTVECLDMHKIK